MAKEFELASFNSLPEFRMIVDEKGFLPLPLVESRPTLLKTFLVVERLENIDEEFWKAVAECVLYAGAMAAVAGLVPGGLAGTPLFLQMFGVRAAAKGLDLTASQLRLRTETCYGEWQRA